MGQEDRGTLVTLVSLGCNESIEEMRDEARMKQTSSPIRHAPV